MSQNQMTDDPNDIPFDIVFGEDGDVCIALPALETLPDGDHAVLAFDRSGMQARQNWIEFQLRRSQEEEPVKLMIDAETAERIITRPADIETIVIAETDAQTEEVRYLYEASVAPFFS